MEKYAIMGVLFFSEVIPGSSMVEQEAVNFEVAGSSPAPGAIQVMELKWLFFRWGLESKDASPAPGAKISS